MVFQDEQDPAGRIAAGQQCGLEQALIAEAEQVGPLTVQDIQRVFSALTPPDVEDRTEFAERAEGSCRTSDLTSHEWQQAYFDETGRLERTLTHLAAENALLRECEGWKPIETSPKDKTRVILAWTTPENLPPHIELGYWSDIKASWVNTYGNPFFGSPDVWFTPPFPAFPSHQEQDNG